jgi:hypothetical protein
VVEVNNDFMGGRNKGRRGVRGNVTAWNFERKLRALQGVLLAASNAVVQTPSIGGRLIHSGDLS